MWCYYDVIIDLWWRQFSVLPISQVSVWTSHQKCRYLFKKCVISLLHHSEVIALHYLWSHSIALFVLFTVLFNLHAIFWLEDSHMLIPEMQKLHHLPDEKFFTKCNENLSNGAFTENFLTWKLDGISIIMQCRS